MDIFASVSDPLLVTVDYNRPHKTQVKESNFSLVGCCARNLVWEEPAEHLFPLPEGETKQQIVLVSVSRHMTAFNLRPSVANKQVLAELEKLNLRPVLSPEFLALTKEHPELLKKSALLGLGSVWLKQGRNRFFLYASWDGALRDLDLRAETHRWPSVVSYPCRFPAIPRTHPTS